jgi:hypothetical protein
VGRCHIETELLHQSGEARRLTLGQLKDEPGQCRGVDDRVLQRAFEAPANQPRVERIVAVLDQNGAVGETKERSTGVAELGRPDQHRPVDVVALLGVRIDRRPAIDERVKEREGARQFESLRAQLQHQERSVACCLDIDGHELRVIEQRLRAQLGCIDRYLLPGDQLCRTTRLQEKWLQACRLSSAHRTKSISSRVTALRRINAAA